MKNTPRLADNDIADIEIAHDRGVAISISAKRRVNQSLFSLAITVEAL